MGSFISNFKRFRTVCACAVLVVGAGVIAGVSIYCYRTNPVAYRYKIQEKIFWTGKIRPSTRYNMVITGDSRAYRGVAPKVLKEKLGIEVFNCGFSSGGNNKVIFKHVTEKLLLPPGNAPRAVLVGVTPRSLSEKSRENKHFLSLLSPEERSWESDVIDFICPQNLLKKLRRHKEKTPQEIFYPDGWCQTNRRQTPKRLQKGLKHYEENYKKTTFSPQSLRELIEQTAAWRKEDIRVFGFWIPTCAEMDALEIRGSGCDMEMVKKEFVKAGGIWIDIDNRAEYQAYDASHLSGEEALKLSLDLAAKLKKFL